MTYDDFKGILASVNRLMCDLTESLDTLKRYSYEELTTRIPKMTDEEAQESLNTTLGEYEAFVSNVYTKSNTLLSKVEELQNI